MECEENRGKNYITRCSRAGASNLAQSPTTSPGNIIASKPCLLRRFDGIFSTSIAPILRSAIQTDVAKWRKPNAYSHPGARESASLRSVLEASLPTVSCGGLVLDVSRKRHEELQ
jgi:hypothetical protein